MLLFHVWNNYNPGGIRWSHISLSGLRIKRAKTQPCLFEISRFFCVYYLLFCARKSWFNLPWRAKETRGQVFKTRDVKVYSFFFFAMSFHFILFASIAFGNSRFFSQRPQGEWFSLYVYLNQNKRPLLITISLFHSSNFCPGVYCSNLRW